MEVILLGSGTSQGVPMIACRCPVCTSADPRNRRTRCSIHVVMDGLHIQVDAAQEFREQCLRNDVERLDLFILTHGHADHVAGMDDLRRFCDLLGGSALTIYSTDEGMSRVIAMYPYAIMERPVVRGYPAFKLLEMPPVLELEQGTIRSTLLPHGGVNVLGLVFEERSSGAKFVYYTDCKRVPAEARALAFFGDQLRTVINLLICAARTSENYGDSLPADFIKREFRLIKGFPCGCKRHLGIGSHETHVLLIE